MRRSGTGETPVLHRHYGVRGLTRGVQRSFVGSPWLCQELRGLRMDRRWRREVSCPNAPHSCRKPRTRDLKGHGFSHAATTLILDSGPARARHHSHPPGTVILSAVASSRSEEATQSKDPYGAANQNTAEENSAK